MSLKSSYTSAAVSLFAILICMILVNSVKPMAQKHNNKLLTSTTSSKSINSRLPASIDTPINGVDLSNNNYDEHMKYYSAYLNSANIHDESNKEKTNLILNKNSSCYLSHLARSHEQIVFGFLKGMYSLTQRKNQITITFDPSKNVKSGPVYLGSNIQTIQKLKYLWSKDLTTLSKLEYKNDTYVRRSKWLAKNFQIELFLDYKDQLLNLNITDISRNSL